MAARWFWTAARVACASATIVAAYFFYRSCNYGAIPTLWFFLVPPLITLSFVHEARRATQRRKLLVMVVLIATVVVFFVASTAAFAGSNSGGCNDASLQIPASA